MRLFLNDENCFNLKFFDTFTWQIKNYNGGHVYFKLYGCSLKGAFDDELIISLCEDDYDVEFSYMNCIKLFKRIMKYFHEYDFCEPEELRQLLKSYIKLDAKEKTKKIPNDLES